MKKNKVIVVGAGASGLMAAYAASGEGARVTVCERNEKPGKKIYITGKGRCNLTNDCDNESFLRHVVTNPKFLYSAISAFSASDTISLMEKLGCRVQTERGNRVFPVSGHASDVTAALVRGINGNGAKIRCHTGIKSLVVTGSGNRQSMAGEKGEKASVAGVITDSGEKIDADRAIICTGGLAYPSTGSDGDGYRFAEMTGHRVGDRMPALVRLRTEEGFVSELQGLSLKNVALSLKAGKKVLYRETGEMLFTDDGVSGPLVLSASSYYAAYRNRYDDFEIHIDLKCGSSFEKTDARVLRDLEEMKSRNVSNALASFLPRSLLSLILRISGIKEDQRARDVTKEERLGFVSIVKDLTLKVAGSGPFTEAVVTHGGVHVGDIDPHTMESKLVSGLYFCGEVLDTDALTGGYNLQTAWSTGYLAGISAGRVH